MRNGAETKKRRPATQVVEALPIPETEWFVVVIPEGDDGFEKAQANARDAGFTGTFSWVHDLRNYKGTPEEEATIQDAKKRGYTLTSGSFSLVYSRPKV